MTLVFFNLRLHCHSHENNSIIKRRISSEIVRAVIAKIPPINPNIFPIFANPFLLYLFGFTLIFFSTDLAKIIAEIIPTRPKG